MEETEKFLKSYSNVCYIVYSQDSITLSYYIQKKRLAPLFCMTKTMLFS